MEYQLFASAKEPKVIQIAKEQPGFRGAQPVNLRIETKWTAESPILVRAMVLCDPPAAGAATVAGKILFIAGPPDLLDERETLKVGAPEAETKALLARQARALDGAEGSILRAVSADDGTTLAEIKLDVAPAFDGLIAANGALYLATLDGRLMCLK
jgi:hypothetical protein